MKRPVRKQKPAKDELRVVVAFEDWMLVVTVVRLDG